MKEFMTSNQVISYLKQQAEKQGYAVTKSDLDDIENLVYTRPWYMEFELVDGRVTLAIPSQSESKELDDVES